MQIFASHFGFYEVAPGPVLRPFRHDPAPSATGLAHLDLARDPSRVMQPMARSGWLEGDRGAARGEDVFVPLTMEAATRLAADEIARVRGTHGNGAIFGGSYGWASAGRFHHAQSQLKRFLNLAGGFVSTVNTYSYGTAKVILPHVLGAEHAESGVFAPSWDQIVAQCRVILAFGGMRLSNAQVEAGSTGAHRTADWLAAYSAAGGRIITLSPDASDAPQGEHLAIRPGTDTAAMLGMAHVLWSEGRLDRGFLDRCTVGAEQVTAYLSGSEDGVPKTADWAAAITGLGADDLRRLARLLTDEPSLINLSWSLQRARYGEQPYWAAVALAAMAGRIGQPGQGLALGLSAIASVGQPVRKLRGPALPVGRNPVSAFIPVARLTDMLERPGEVLDYDGQSLTLPNIRLIWWAGGNPYHHHQDLNRLRAAWKRPETVIVQESVWTATARHADLVFPSALPFERSDVAAASRDSWIGYSARVMDPPQGVLTDHETLAQVAAHLGLEGAFRGGRTEDQWLQHIYEGYAAEFPELPDWDSFRLQGFAQLDAWEAAPAPYTPLAAFVADQISATLSTPSGKIELASATVASFGYADCPGHPVWLDPDEPGDLPFRLLSPQPETRLHSQLDRAGPARQARWKGLERLRANPADLLAASVADGDVAELYNDRGIVLVAATADPKVAQGTLVLPTGGWFNPVRDALDRVVDLGGNPNTLTADLGSSRLSQGASANHPRVGLRALRDPDLLKKLEDQA